MPYTVNFTNTEKTALTVADNVSNTETSLVLPGRNTTGYGRVIAENFLHLLENFAGPTEPINPVEGQLWYDTVNEQLKINDGTGSTGWKAASNIQTAATQPAVASSRQGDLWVDISNQQLYIFTGNDWILVGPFFSNGTKSGPLVESIIDADGGTQTVLIFYVSNEPVAIVSSTAFVPKAGISGFTEINPGLNVSSATLAASYTTKLTGLASSAEALRIGGADVTASKFLRTDTTNTTEAQFNVRSNAGITIGIDSNLSIQSSETGATIYNRTSGGNIDLQVPSLGNANTVVRIVDQKVGINNLSPTAALDVTGDSKISGKLVVNDVTPAGNLITASTVISGGLSVNKNAIVGQTLEVLGDTISKDILPSLNEIHSIGNNEKRFLEVRAKKIIADTFQGTLEGTITGNAGTATKLKFPTTFSLQGEVISTNFIEFNGFDGGLTQIFQTELSANIISGKPELTYDAVNRTGGSQKTDQILVNRPGAGLRKMTRDTFVGELGVPIGTILPFAGKPSSIPIGYLLCDGSEVEKTKYQELYDIIGDLHGAPVLNPSANFKLPDLRGRFALGRDNMENGLSVSNTSNNLVDAGGGNASRVAGAAADITGGTGGTSTQTLNTSNLPDHEHDMRGYNPNGTKGNQFFAHRADTAVPPERDSQQGPGGTIPNAYQLLRSSGGVKTDGLLGQEFSIMSPYLTVNYIIRSGLPAYGGNPTSFS